MPELQDGTHTKDISDGYHTFGELYEWRHVLFCLVLSFNSELDGPPTTVLPRESWWTRNHHPENDPMFEVENEPGILVGIELAHDISVQFHMPARYISVLQSYNVKELPHGPYYDGIHSPERTLTRLKQFLGLEK